MYVYTVDVEDHAFYFTPGERVCNLFLQTVGTPHTGITLSRLLYYDIIHLQAAACTRTKPSCHEHELSVAIYERRKKTTRCEKNSTFKRKHNTYRPHSPFCFSLAQNIRSHGERCMLLGYWYGKKKLPCARISTNYIIIRIRYTFCNSLFLFSFFIF